MDDKEIEMLLNEIPVATYHHLLQQQQNNYNHHHHPNGHVYVHGGQCHGSIPIQTVHGMNGMYEDGSCHPKYMCRSPVSGLSLKSEGSSSSSHSGVLSFFDDGSPTPPPLEETKSQMQPKNTHNSHGFWLESKLPDFPIGKNSIGNLMDEPSLSTKLSRMCISDEQIDSPLIGQHPISSYRFQFSEPCWAKINCGNVEKSGPFKDCRKGFYDYRGFECSLPACAMSFDEGMRSRLLGKPQGCQIDNSSGSFIAPDQFSSLFSPRGHCTGPVNSSQQQTKVHSTSEEMLRDFQLQAGTGFGKIVNNMRTRINNGSPSIIRPSTTNAFFYSQQDGMDYNGDREVLDSFSPHLTHLNVPLGLGYLQHHSLPKSNRWVGATPNFCIPQSFSSTRNAWDIEAFNCEDSLIMEGEGLNYVMNKRGDLSREHKKHYCNETGPGHPNVKHFKLDGLSHSRGVSSFHFEDSCSPRISCPLPLKYNSLLDVQGSIYLMAKDQNGCRFLQRKFDEGTPQDVQMIFNEIIDHAVELMMNPFGNYLMQKLLDVCDEEQRLQILLMVTIEPGKLVKISLNTHGTRVVQKLIETVKTQHQISLIISALEPGFIDLINDLSGNHVLHRCLHCLSYEDNKFIFEAATKFCLDIATHRHGCCVLQRCIGHSMGEHQENLAAKISSNGLFLAQDPFGNYVVQYVLEMKIPSATANLISQFKGNYVHLSMQKFSSNVVQKCLNVFTEENRSRIIHELLLSHQLEQLLQDPFANYVIQSALGVSKGPLHASLVEAIRPHAAALRSNPYSKRIFSRTLLRK